MTFIILLLKEKLLDFFYIIHDANTNETSCTLVRKGFPRIISKTSDLISGFR